jgi:predicted aspartyl protease
MKPMSLRQSWTSYSVILSILVLCAWTAQGATDNWQHKDVNWQAGGGRLIKGISFPKDRPLSTEPGRPSRPETSVSKSKAALQAEAAASLANEMLVESPPVAGFVPWIAISITKQHGDDLELDAVVEPTVRGSYPSGVNPQTDYIIGLFDTGASAHVIGYADAQRAGLSGSLIGPSESEISGVSGSVTASVSMPLGLFVCGLDAVDPDTLSLDRSLMVGESNVAVMVGQNPGSGPDLPTAIGSPMSVYYTTVLRNDQLHTIVRDDQEFTGPDIHLYNQDDSDIPVYANIIPLELRPLGGVSVEYIPTLDLGGLGGLGDLGDIFGGDLGSSSDFPPASPSVIIGNFSQSLFFVHSVDLYEGEKSAIDKDRFMLDTGAQVSVVGSRIAARLQLDPQAPEFEVELEGVSGESITAPGFYVDTIEIPALGQWLRATQVPVVLMDVSSPEGGTLDGIIGMNLFVDFNLIVRGGGLFLQADPALELQRIEPGT